MLLVVVITILFLSPLVMPRTFYIPSEAMEPTLRKGDRILAAIQSFEPDQTGPRPLRRGDIILLNVGENLYIKRVAALPGDRFEMIEGVVFLNGRRVPQRYLRDERIESSVAPGMASRFSEQFPGERSPHEIYDTGYSQGDDFAALRIPPGHLFVLGDNRDHSADSRFRREEQGVSLLPITDVIGLARSIYWRPGSGFDGTPLTSD